MKTILTGIRSNSVMTLGNYLGAMLPMVRLANKYSFDKDFQVNIFVPDLHSIISEVDGDLQENTLRTLKSYLAAGLKLNKNVHIYRQSYVPAHSELCWILNCVATMGETSRMIQYKEKSEGRESCNVGVFDYPILMAADILLYSANYVPIGEDQFQHIELARDLAIRFNHKFGQEIFVVPEKTAEQVKFMGEKEGVRIRDLLNPEKKMSKSTKAEGSKIMMDDDPSAASKKIMRAATDSFQEIKYNMSERPGISNLLLIESLVTGKPLSDVVNEWAGKTRYGDLKKQVAADVEAMLVDFQTKIAGISDAEVYSLLEEGEKYANGVAGKKLFEAQEAFGLR